MKPEFPPVLFAAAAAILLAWGGARAGDDPPEPEDTQRILAETNLCDWFEQDDAITWDAASPVQVAQWARAVRDISFTSGLSAQDASRRLVAMCRDRLASRQEKQR